MKIYYSDEHRREDEHYERLGKQRAEENARHERFMNFACGVWLLCTAALAVVFILNPAFWFVLMARLVLAVVGITALVFAYRYGMAAIRGK